MAEKETIFSSKIKYNGIFNFKDFYSFCYTWLKENFGLDLIESEYSESLEGDSKNIDIKWSGSKNVSDYFKFEVGIKFKIIKLTKVEISQGGGKFSTNKGNIELAVTGTLIRDWQGKFEVSAIQKFLRSVYEKWIISSRISEFEGALIGGCDEFLSQAKAYLDLEGKK